MSGDAAAERAHGGLVSRSGDIVTLGDGSRWWLNGTDWARTESDALIFRGRIADRDRLTSKS